MRGGSGHDDGRLDAEPNRVIGDRLGVVAADVSIPPPPPLAGRERQEAVQPSLSLNAEVT